MRYLRLLPIFFCLLIYTSTSAAEEDTLRLIGNKNLKGTIKIGEQSQTVSGGVSLSLSASKNEIQSGKISVNDLNIRYIAVNQQMITGRRPKGKPTSVLGFRVSGKHALQFLNYDAERKTLKGTINGKIDFAQLSELSPFRMDQKNDIYLTPTQDASVEVSITLDKALDLRGADSQVLGVEGNISFKVSAAAIGQLNIPRYTIESPSIRLTISYTLLYRYEIARNLCIQPVRFRSSAFNLIPSGAGLAFGLPGATTEWAKADVTFTVRSWKTVTNAALTEASSSEMESILSQVQDDDCIEVFFPDRFSPNDLYGGGATFGSGTASAQIVSSDENAVHGIDMTHLAHELGHVVGLHHPGAGYPTPARPEVIDGSSGTLLCPSGFMNDNPAINSGENKDNLHNPLLTFTLKVRSAGPDCADSADCGACP